MLWNIIRDWFVQYIWGGTSSSGNIVNNAVVGNNLNTNNTMFTLGDASISLADWLSTFSTIVTLILLITMLMVMVRFVIRQIAGLYARI